jgi:hypothetical protein
MCQDGTHDLPESQLNPARLDRDRVESLVGFPREMEWAGPVSAFARCYGLVTRVSIRMRWSPIWSVKPDSRRVSWMPEWTRARARSTPRSRSLRRSWRSSHQVTRSISPGRQVLLIHGSSGPYIHRMVNQLRSGTAWTILQGCVVRVTRPTVPPRASLPAECWRVARDDNRLYLDAGSRARMMVETIERGDNQACRWVVTSERRPSWPPVAKRLRLLEGSARRCAKR